jgi:hypothetical protein
VAWLARVDAEQDNLRAARDWWLQHDGEAAIQMTSALWWHWMVRGNHGEGRAWLDKLLRQADNAVAGHSLWKATATWQAGELAFLQGDLQAGLARRGKSAPCSAAC